MSGGAVVVAIVNGSRSPKVLARIAKLLPHPADWVEM
jgi:hypothetical protein